MQKRWFVHDGEDLEFYDSESAARAAALDAVEKWRAIGTSEGEWPEEVEQVMWGRIEQSVVAHNKDYVLVDVEPKGPLTPTHTVRQCANDIHEYEQAKMEEI